MNRRIKKRPSIVIQPLPDRTNDTLIHLQWGSFWYNDIINITFENDTEHFLNYTLIHLINNKSLKDYHDHNKVLMAIDTQANKLKSGGVYE